MNRIGSVGVVGVSIMLTIHIAWCETEFPPSKDWNKTLSELMLNKDKIVRSFLQKTSENLPDATQVAQWWQTAVKENIPDATTVALYYELAGHQLPDSSQVSDWWDASVVGRVPQSATVVQYYQAAGEQMPSSTQVAEWWNAWVAERVPDATGLDGWWNDAQQNFRNRRNWAPPFRSPRMMKPPESPTDGWWLNWNKQIPDATEWADYYYQALSVIPDATGRADSWARATHTLPDATQLLQLRQQGHHKLKEIYAVEYQVLVAPLESGALEQQELLAAAGADSWECFHVLRTLDGIYFYMKRPKVSALKHIPLQDALGFLRWMTGGVSVD